MRIIVHIGLAKCGSTTLQDYFATHRDALARQGIDYPFLKEMRALNLNTNLHNDWVAGRPGLEDAIRNSTAHTLVLSSEYLSQWLRRFPLEPMQADGRFARAQGHMIETLTITRPHEDFLKSLYKQAIVNATKPRPLFADNDATYGTRIHRTAHSHFLEHFSDGQGRSINLQNPDWLDQAADFIGADLPKLPQRSNNSLPDVASEILRQINGLGDDRPGRHYVARLFELTYGKTSDVLSIQANKAAHPEDLPISDGHFDRLEPIPNPPLRYTQDSFESAVERLRDVWALHSDAFEPSPIAFRTTCAKLEARRVS